MSDAALDTKPSVIARLLVEGGVKFWLRKYGYIRLKNKALKKIELNPLQTRAATIIAYMLEHKLPVRILIYKPRQKGSSTWSMACMDWFIKRFGHNGYVVGESLDNCDNLWGILRTYNENDGYDWGWPVEITTKTATYGNGAKAKWATSKNAESGRSATIGAMVCTEIARWAEAGTGKVRDAGKVFSGLMGGVPKEPNTLVIAESTVRGASGVFYEQWQSAKTFEQLKAGDYDYGDFIKIFIPWYVFDDSVLPCSDKEAAGILDGSTALNEEERAREMELLTRYRLTPGHIKYFRMRLKECDWDPEERDREEPTTEESGFHASQPCFFNKQMLRRMRTSAEMIQHLIKRGTLQWDHEKERRSVNWLPENETERPLWMMGNDEDDIPTVGLRYIISVDNARGVAVDEAGKDPDCHAVTCVREGYMNQKGTWRPPRVVCCLRPKYRGEIDLLAEEIAKLSRFYGNALVVPEANNDCGLIAALRKLGVPVFERMRPATDVNDQLPTGKYGIWTSDSGDGHGMRSQFLNALQTAIRRMYYQQEGLEIPFLHILDELETFAVNLKTGKAEALKGKHDDFVMALAFGYHLRNLGTIMVPSVRMTELPREMQRMLAVEERMRTWVQSGGGAHEV